MIDRLKALSARMRAEEQRLCRQADGQGQTYYAERLAAKADGFGTSADWLDTLIAELAAEQRHPIAELLKRLPDDINAPEIILEPDADLGIEWFADRFVLSISLRVDGHACWAALGPTHKSHGKFIVESEWPAELLDAFACVARAEALP